MPRSRLLQAAGNFSIFKVRELFRRRAGQIKLTRIRKADEIIVGPWMGEVGFEVLYWIPFLHFLVESQGFDPGKFKVISRGGVKNWYSGIGKIEYFDIFNSISPAEFMLVNERRVSRTGAIKQLELHQDEIDILEKITGRLVRPESVLHPGEMFSRFLPYWQKACSLEKIENHSIYRRFAFTDTDTIKNLGLEKGSYVSAKFYFSDALIDNAINLRAISKLLTALAKTKKVVLLQSGTKVDDHSDVMGELFRHPNIVVPELEMKPAENLEKQSQIVGNSSMFFGTYGGFSYLAPFYGVKSIACFSERTFQPAHNDVMLRALLALQNNSNFSGPEFLCASLNGILEIVDGMSGSA
jgi:hypothetical protein